MQKLITIPTFLNIFKKDNLKPLKEGEPSLLKLREIAKANKIKVYIKMTKEELEKAIKELDE